VIDGNRTPPVIASSEKEKRPVSQILPGGSESWHANFFTPLGSRTSYFLGRCGTESPAYGSGGVKSFRNTAHPVANRTTAHPAKNNPARSKRIASIRRMPRSSATGAGCQGRWTATRAGIINISLVRWLCYYSGGAGADSFICFCLRASCWASSSFILACWSGVSI